MNTDWIPAAYESANGGDWADFAGRIGPGYVHRLSARDIVWKGRDETIAGLKEIYAQFGLKQTVTSVAEHGPFVVVNIEMSSSLRGGTQDAVHVFRATDDLLVECWVCSVPLTAG